MVGDIFFATNLDGKEELFADRPGEEGKDCLEASDTRGKYQVREMIDVVRSAGEGFVEYTWAKPASEENDFPQVAFAKLSEPLNYLVGTGEYIDDITAEIQAEVLRRVGKIRYTGGWHIFIVSYDGAVPSGHPEQKNGEQLSVSPSRSPGFTEYGVTAPSPAPVPDRAN